MKKELNSTKDDLKTLKKSLDVMETKTNNLLEQSQKVDEKIEDLNFRSMRENLLFYGIPESSGAENCEALCKNVCKTILKMDESDRLTIDRAHRVGGRSNKPRPIVMKFHYFSEREAVRNRSIEYSAALKAENRGIGIQLPKSVRDARKSLYGPMKAAKDAGKHVRFVGKKLLINGEEFRPSAPTN